jgi:hypothetical protein
VFKCVKCGCYERKETIETDKYKKNKKWCIFRCAHCDHPYDLAPYTPLIPKPQRISYEREDYSDPDTYEHY